MISESIPVFLWGIEGLSFIFGITAVVVHRGWVSTDIGNRGAKLSVNRSIACIIKVVDGLNLVESGRFLDWNGEEIPW